MLILVPDSYNYVPRGRGLELFKLLPPTSQVVEEVRGSLEVFFGFLKG